MARDGPHTGHALTIQPEHCLLGSAGHSVEPGVNSAVQVSSRWFFFHSSILPFNHSCVAWKHWSYLRRRPVTYACKGSSALSDWTSALYADVAQTDDPSSRPDPMLLRRLAAADKVCARRMHSACSPRRMYRAPVVCSPPLQSIVTKNDLFVFCLFVLSSSFVGSAIPPVYGTPPEISSSGPGSQT